MSVTISTLCMFIYGDDVSYFETLFNHSKLCNLNTLLKMVKNTNKLCRGFIIRKNNKNKLKENGWIVCTFAGVLSLTLGASSIYSLKSL